MSHHTITLRIEHGHGRIDVHATDQDGRQIAQAAGYSLGYALSRLGDALAAELEIRPEP